jgi:hypothetical protein
MDSLSPSITSPESNRELPLLDVLPCLNYKSVAKIAFDIVLFNAYLGFLFA